MVIMNAVVDPLSRVALQMKSGKMVLEKPKSKSGKKATSSFYAGVMKKNSQSGNRGGDMKKSILCVAFFFLISGSLCASDDPCHLAVQGSANNDARALQRIAECLQRVNRWEEALKHIERAIEIDPNDLQSQRIKANIVYYIREHNQAIDGPGAICP